MFSKAIALVLTLGSSSHALAQDPGPLREPSFSAAGRTLVAGSVSGQWQSQSGSDSWSVSLQPSLAHFIRDRLALGLLPGYSTGEESFSYARRRYHELSLAAYALIDLPLAERVSLLFIPSIGYAYRRQQSGLLPADHPPVGNVSGQSLPVPNLRHAFRLGVQLPVVFHASSSIVLGLGPFFLFDRRFGHTVEGVLVVNEVDQQQIATFSPFSPQRNTFQLGLSSFVGATF